VSGGVVGTQKKQPHNFLRKRQGLWRFRMQGLPGKQSGCLQRDLRVNGDESGSVSDVVRGSLEEGECREKSSTPEESFFVQRNQRQEVEKEELEEFELMEQLADQSSFSSQCSLAKKVMAVTSKQQAKDHRDSDSETDNDNEIIPDATLTGDETQDEDDDSVSSLSDVQSIKSDAQGGLASKAQLSSHAIGIDFDDEDTWDNLRPNSNSKFNPLTSTPPVKSLVSRQRKVYRPSKQHALDAQKSSNNENHVVEHAEQPNESSQSSSDEDSTLISDSLYSNSKQSSFSRNKTAESTSLRSAVRPSAVSPPPTSTLVTKLFPSLHNGQNQVKQSPLKVGRPVSVVREVGLKGDEVSAMAVKQKLAELEMEIERFKRENLAVSKLKEEREKALKEMTQARIEFDKWKGQEVSQFEVYKEEELKRIKHEKRLFEQYRMAVQNAPDRKEREEIAALKKEILELQNELENRESRWAAANERYRGRISALERENTELKQELKVMEEQRLTHWMKQFESRSNDEQVEQMKQPKQKQLTGKVRQPTLINQKDKHEEKSPQSTGTGRKKGDTKSSNHIIQTQSQKSHAKSSKKRSDAVSANRSVQLSDKSGTLSDETSQEMKTADLKSESTNGNTHSIEHPDGRVEIVKADGSKTIKYLNGTKKDVSSDGLTITLSFFNGDIKRILPDQKVVYYYAETKTQQTTYPDGLEVMEFSRFNSLYFQFILDPYLLLIVGKLRNSTRMEPRKLFSRIRQ
jgi:centromere protein J